MSTQVLSCVDDAAIAVGDPDKQRISLAQWLSIYNRANRELCEKVNLIRVVDEFDLLNLDPDTGKLLMRYAYPELMTVLMGVHVTDTPEDHSTMRWIPEEFEDVFRARTSASYPVATLPEWYYATSSWFNLVPAVSADILGGACLDYYSLPDPVPDLNGVLQVPDVARDYLTRKMIILGLMARNRYTEAREELQMWTADIETLQDKLDDRAQDKRSTLAPRRNTFAGQR